MGRRGFDAVVVGSGPNGLAAAITLARAGRSVLVREARPEIGGGARSAALTLPGFVHDVFSAVHPLGVGSPFFRQLPLAEHGLEWVHPPAPLAHPLDDGSAVLLERSVDQTAQALGEDADAYRALIAPFSDRWEALAGDVLRFPRLPRHPALLARFGMLAMRSAAGLAASRFRGERAASLFAGLAAHSMAPLTEPFTAAFGLLLAVAGHAVGWPIPRGGAQALATALASYFVSLGGVIETDAPVRSLDELPPSRAVFLDLTPRQVLRVAGRRLPDRYRRRLERFRYGPGAFKIDWALSGPIPWTAPECARAGTVHLGGSIEEMIESEAAPWQGRTAERPYVLLAQPTLFDPSRAPAGKHVAWAYCHVPHGSAVDMTERMEAQVERFAPGFRARILARHVMGPAELERMNENLVGGDIGGGAVTGLQLLFRPTLSPVPYRTPVKGLYLCSASTPPGGGVHGMCGYNAARAALRDGV